MGQPKKSPFYFLKIIHDDSNSRHSNPNILATDGKRFEFPGMENVTARAGYQECLKSEQKI